MTAEDVRASGRSPQHRRPWQRQIARRARPDVTIVGGRPLAQITIYPDLTVLTRRAGMSWRQYPVEPEALATVLADVPRASGLLPQNTLGDGHARGTPFYVLYVPARRATLRMEQQDYPIPLPPLIWAGCGQDYRIWALGTPDYPDDTRLPLFKAPFPNTYDDGHICWGSTDARPVATPKTLAAVLKLFLEESYFNLHVAGGKSLAFPTSVVAQWQALLDSGAEVYPLDDLLPAGCQLGWLLGGGPWM